MKDKTISETHYDYANELTKILGFKNLADFETQISYTNLKENEENICKEFNKRIDLFKKLFPQEGFDLRKINNVFKTIDQIIGFYKKILNYLFIAYNFYRKKGISTMRLIPQNNLYNNYIMKMREIPQNSNNILEQKEVNICKNQIDMQNPNEKMISMKNVLNYLLNKSIEKKYIISKNSITLNIIKSFDYFNWIKIRKSENRKLTEKTIIELSIGGTIYLSKEINSNDNFDCSDYFKFEIDLPNNILYRYHDIILSIYDFNNSDNTFELIINGKQFKTTIPKNIFDSNIVFDHDIKWYDIENNKRCVSCAGIFNNSNSIKDKIYYEENDIIDLFKFFQKDSKVNFKTIKINNCEETCVILDINLKKLSIKKDNIKLLDPLKYLVSPKFREYLKNNNLIKSTDFSFCSNIYNSDSNTHNICEIINSNICKLYYIIYRNCDLIKHFDIEFIKKMSNEIYDIDCEILLDTTILYNFKNIKINENKLRIDIPNDELINLTILQNNVLYLVFNIPNSKYCEWNENIKLSCGSIYTNSKNRIFLAKNDESVKLL